MFRIVSIVGILGTIGALALYHLALRAGRIGPDHGARLVRRFTLLERLTHAVAVASCAVLAFTGFLAALCAEGSLTGWLWLAHYAAAPFFAGALALIALIWADDCRLERHDWRWMLHLGGYLWRKDNLPAGRFNAGQKAFLWFAVVLGIALVLSGVGRMFPLFGAQGQQLLVEVHRYSALLLVMGTLAHLYLGIFTNPGTIWAMITGRVSAEWARHHHPTWWESIEQE